MEKGSHSCSSVNSVNICGLRQKVSSGMSGHAVATLLRNVLAVVATSDVQCVASEA